MHRVRKATESLKVSKGGPIERGGSIPTASAIVVAAGRGDRMGGGDKIFDPLPGARDKPALAFSVEVLEASPHVDAIVLVVSADRVSRCETLACERGWSKVAGVWPGGDRRQDSVAAGLSRLPDAEWVVVHDGARPFLTAEMLVRGLCAARHTGAAVAAVPVTDTIKRVDPDGFSAGTLDRERLRSVQTPQVFRRDLLAKAHAHADGLFTDDAAMVEDVGGRVRLFEGARDNIKLTTPEDYAAAEAILARWSATAGGA